MNGEIRLSISVVTAAAMLMACASKGPVKAEDAAAADAADQAPSEYQQLADNANNQMVCRWQAVTGSRIASQVCFTRAQLEEQRQRAADTVRDIQDNAAMRRATLPDRPSMPTSPPAGR